jgi:hypothetical protein
MGKLLYFDKKKLTSKLNISFLAKPLYFLAKFILSFDKTFLFIG